MTVEHKHYRNVILPKRGCNKVFWVESKCVRDSGGITVQAMADLI